MALDTHSSTDQDVPLDLSDVSKKSLKLFKTKNKKEHTATSTKDTDSKDIFSIKLNKIIIERIRKKAKKNLSEKSVDINNKKLSQDTDCKDSFSIKLNKLIIERIQDQTNTNCELNQNSKKCQENENIDDEHEIPKDLSSKNTKINRLDDETNTWISECQGSMLDSSDTQMEVTPDLSLVRSSSSEIKDIKIENLETNSSLSNNLDIGSVCNTKKRPRNSSSTVKRNNVCIVDPENTSIRGGPMLGKSMKPPCKCVYKCYNKIDFNDRTHIFQTFWKLGDRQKQLQFILKYTERLKKSKCYSKDSPRQYSFKYKLPIISKDKTIKVCKKMYLNTLLLNDKIIRTTWDKFENTEVVQIKKPCLKKVKNNTKETMVQSVRDHIRLLPPIEMEYFGLYPNQLRFDQILNISRMFQSYSEWFDPNKYVCMATTETQYKDIARNNISIDIQVLKEDHCDLFENNPVQNNKTVMKSTQSGDNAEKNITSNKTVHNNSSMLVSDYMCYSNSEIHSCIKDELPIEKSFCNTNLQLEDNKGETHSNKSDTILKPSSRFFIRVIINLTKLAEEVQENNDKNITQPDEQAIKLLSNPLEYQDRRIQDKTIGGKSIVDPCICRHKCYNKINYNERLNLLKYFSELKDKEKQSNFLTMYTEKYKKKRCVSRSLTNDRNFTFKYKLPLMSKDVTMPVCKQMFLNTLMVSDNTVKTAWENLEVSTIADQERIISQYREVIVKTMAKSVRDHVNSFLPIETHFLGRKANKLYLDGSLNIPLMFRLYNEWFDPDIYSRMVKTERKYKEIVEKNFNLGFHVTKKDQCDQCQTFRELKIPSDEQTGRHIIHTESIVTVHNKKNQDKIEAIDSNGKIMAAIFDFEKLLTCPYGPEIRFNNKRKLLCFNFTIFDLNSKRPICYMWDELVAKNGGDEVSSCLLKFINSNIENGVEEFRFWSDNDDSRNYIFFCLYRYIVCNYKVNIYHNFHVKDHVQSEIVSVDSVIKKVSSTKNIFIPEEWKAVVKCSRTNSQEPFTVIDMPQDEFYNFSYLHDDLDWQKDSKGKIIPWCEVREIFISSNDPFKIKFRYEFNQDYEAIELTKDFKFLKISPMYHEMLPLNHAKYKDLISLCDNGAIPEEYNSFYKSLPYCEDVSNVLNEK